MANTMADVNAKIDELLKDVRRVLDAVKNAPTAAATQEQVDALADRLDGFNAEVEAVSPEPAPEPTPEPVPDVPAPDPGTDPENPFGGRRKR